jgi:hypothetical protein
VDAEPRPLSKLRLTLPPLPATIELGLPLLETRLKLTLLLPVAIGSGLTLAKLALLLVLIGRGILRGLRFLLVVLSRLSVIGRLSVVGLGSE